MPAPGRPKGLPKTGGRAKGTKNKRIVALQKAAADGGMLPLDVMLLDMRRKLDAGDVSGAADRARDAANYLHARLAAQTISAPGGGPVEFTWKAPS